MDITGYMGPIMGKDEIERTVEAIKRVTTELIAQGPEACRQYIDDLRIPKPVEFDTFED